LGRATRRNQHKWWGAIHAGIISDIAIAVSGVVPGLLDTIEVGGSRSISRQQYQSPLPADGYPSMMGSMEGRHDRNTIDAKSQERRLH